MTLARQRLGREGEQLACAELERLGYRLLSRRYRTRYGEIDIVAEDGEVLVFVEVKARTDDSFGHPAEAVTDQKQHRVVAMAEAYLAREQVGDRVCRFDVVAVDGTGAGAAITVYRDAFRPGW
jgi:putative endonuclease